MNRNKSLAKEVNLKISGNIQLETSAIHFSTEEILNANPINKLQKGKSNYWNIECRHVGLGGYCCSREPVGKYLLNSEPIACNLFFENKPNYKMSKRTLRKRKENYTL